MSIYLKSLQTTKDTQDRFTANLFSNLSNRWYPVNIIGSTLYDVLSMYGLEFASGSIEITQTANDLFIETVRAGIVDGHSGSKMYENFGILVDTDKLPYQEYGQFNTGSVLNSYRTLLKFLTLAHTEGTTDDALARVGQAFTGISPVVLEMATTYPGWTLTSYTGSVVTTIGLATSDQRYAYVSPAFGRFGSTIPVQTPEIVTGSTVSLSYSVLGTNTVVYDQDAYHAGVMLFFFIPYGTSAYNTAVRAGITNAVSRVLPAYITPIIAYSLDFVSWRPVAPPADTMVASSSVFAVSPLGWVYNATPTPISGSMYTTDVIQIP